MARKRELRSYFGNARCFCKGCGEARSGETAFCMSIDSHFLTAIKEFAKMCSAAEESDKSAAEITNVITPDEMLAIFVNPHGEPNSGFMVEV